MRKEKKKKKKGLKVGVFHNLKKTKQNIILEQYRMTWFYLVYLVKPPSSLVLS